MDMIGKVRRMKMRDGVSISEISRKTGLSRNTVKKWLKAPAATQPRYERAQKVGKLSALEATLVAALKTGHVRHAYLDVFHTEPLPTESPLWDLPNVLISPHNAGASTGTYARGVEIFLRNLARYLNAGHLENEASLL